MSEIKKILRCYKCGVILQDSDSTKPGYIISEVLNNHTSEILLCNTCFEKTIFHPTPKMSEFSDDIYVFLEDAQAADALVVLVIDVFSFEGVASKKFIDAIGSCNVICIANKMDLLPSGIDDEALKKYVFHRMRVFGINVQEVFLCSTKGDNYIGSLSDVLAKYRKRHDIYLIGFPNSGKTTLANLFLKCFKNNTRRLISTINYPGTSTKVFEIPLDRTSVLYDVPGFVTNNSICDHLEPSLENQIVPSKQIQKRSVTISVNSGFSLGGLARFDLLEGDKTTFDVYASEKIEIKVFSRAKDLDRAFFDAIAKKSVRPTSKYLVGYENFDIFDIEITEENLRDIGILGLGWISFKAKKQKIRVTLPKGVYLYTTRNKITYVNKQTKK